MARYITWLGQSYSAVPYIELPATGGGTARFDDASVTTATASDVASGKVFLAADGTVTTGTNSGGGGALNFGTKNATASNYPTSLSFAGLSGEPKAFVVRADLQISSSGSTTYYYIVEVAAFGDTVNGTCFRIGSTRRTYNIDSGYSWSYSNGTLTITSSASSRSASPGAFYSGSYELLYAY